MMFSHRQELLRQLLNVERLADLLKKQRKELVLKDGRVKNGQIQKLGNHVELVVKMSIADLKLKYLLKLLKPYLRLALQN